MKTPSHIKGVRPGIALWVAFAILAVLVRGVRWDETYEHAQALTQSVPYPAGHPLLVYTQRALSVQTLVSSALLKIGAGAALLCGIRNVLFMLATTLPVFLLTTLLTRKAIWGHLATLLMLQGVLLEFDGSYPTFVWPDLYSNGHIGGAFALLTLYFILAGHVRTAVFLFGVMPAVHIGQWPVLLALVPLYAFWTYKQGGGEALRRAAPFLVLGVVLAGGVYGLHASLSDAPPTDGLYATTGDSVAIWRGYTTRHDPHRQFPPGNGHVILAGTLLLATMLATRAKDATVRHAAAWIGIYAGGIALAVWGIMIVHATMGADIPFLLIAWMPYRLINHIPTLFMALCVGAIINGASRSETETREATHKCALGVWIVLALVACAARPVVARVIPGDIYTAYVAQGDGIAFFLFGVALLVLIQEIAVFEPRRVKYLAFMLGCAVVALALYHQFGTACMILGILFHVALVRWKQYARLARFIHLRLLITLCLAVATLLLQHQWRYRQSLPNSDFNERVTTYLAEQNAPDAMLLARPDEYMLQARTGHPVLLEAATPSLISYLPSVAPVIEQTYQDIYGISFKLQGQELASPTWEAIWKQRTAQEWAELTARYQFQYVVAAKGLELNLDEVVADEYRALYAAMP